MGSWKISYEIKNFELDRQEIRINDVIFHLRNLNLVVGKVTINGNNTEEAIIQAKQKIDRAVNELAYIYDRDISIITDGFYTIDLENQSKERITRQWVINYDIGMDSIQATRSSKLETFNLNKTEVLSKVLGLYKNAPSSQNPFNAIETLFSCIEGVVNDMFSLNYDIKKGLKDILSKRNKNFNEQEFYNKFAMYYGRGRSKSTHGKLDVSDHQLKSQASKAVSEVKQWVWEALDEFITKNQINSP